MFQKTTLKNKVRLILVPMRNTEAVTVLVLVGTGSKYETKKISGISHFLEHVFFKGTKKRPSTVLIAEPMDRVGGVFNAFTGEDLTGYYAKVQPSKFELALEWVSDIFLNSTLPEDEINKEKGVIIEEINMIYDNPTSYISVLWPKVLYGDQPAGWDIAGTKESVGKMDRRNLLEYRRKQYTAQNTIVVISGKIEPQETKKLVLKHFSGVKKAVPLKKPEVLEKQTCPEVLFEKRKTDQSHLCLGVRGYNAFHKKRYGFEILGVALGGMMSSRLFIEVRAKLGLAYYIKTDTETNPDTGYLVTQAGVRNDKIKEVILAILKEYKKIRESKISATELKKAKDNVKGKMALSLESSDAKASFYGVQELLENKILTPKEIYAKIDTVSTDDIQEIAKDIFVPQNLNLALIGPQKNGKEIKKWLSDF